MPQKVNPLIQYVLYGLRLAKADDSADLAGRSPVSGGATAHAPSTDPACASSLDLMDPEAHHSPEIRSLGTQLRQALKVEDQRHRSRRHLRDAVQPFIRPDGLLPLAMAQQVEALEASVDTQVRGATLDDLPPDILAQILSHLGPKGLVAAGAVCRTLRRESRDDAQWRYERVRNLTMLALECWPVDVKRKAEVSLTNWIVLL